METKINCLGGMQVESISLDKNADEAQKRLNDIAFREYEDVGSLSSLYIREEVSSYELDLPSLERVSFEK